MIINFAPTTYARAKVWTEYPTNSNLEYYQTVPKNELIDFF